VNVFKQLTAGIDPDVVKEAVVKLRDDRERARALDRERQAKALATQFVADDDSWPTEAELDELFVHAFGPPTPPQGPPEG